MNLLVCVSLSYTIYLLLLFASYPFSLKKVDDEPTFGCEIQVLLFFLFIFFYTNYKTTEDSYLFSKIKSKNTISFVLSKT